MIRVAIKSRSEYSFDHRRLRRRIKEFIKKTGLDDVEVSLAVVGRRRMRKLNQDFRQLDKVSDVLAFPQEEIRRPDGVLLLGDIVVCYPQAQEEALAYQESIDEAIWDFVEHGLNRLIDSLK